MRFCSCIVKVTTRATSGQLELTDITSSPPCTGWDYNLKANGVYDSCGRTTVFNFWLGKCCPLLHPERSLMHESGEALILWNILSSIWPTVYTTCEHARDIHVHIVADFAYYSHIMYFTHFTVYVRQWLGGTIYLALPRCLGRFMPDLVCIQTGHF